MLNKQVLKCGRKSCLSWQYLFAWVSGFSVQNECEGVRDTGFGEQRGCDCERPAGAGRGGAEQHGTWGQADVSIQSDGLFEVIDVRGAGEVFGAWRSGPGEAVEQRQFADSGDVLGEQSIALHLCGWCWCGDHDSGALLPVFFPAGEQLNGSVKQFGWNGGVVAVFELSEFGGPAGVISEGDGAGRRAGGDGTFAAAAFGPQFAGFDEDILLSEEAACLLNSGGFGMQSGCWQVASTDGAAAAGCGLWIAECLLEICHEAAATVGIVAHECGFVASSSNEGLPFAGVVNPRFACGGPFAAVLANGVIDSENFQEGFQSSAADGCEAFQIDDAERLSGQCLEGAIGGGLIGNIGGCEVFPDGFIAAGGQQDGFSVIQCATGSTNLLIVCHGSAW